MTSHIICYGDVIDDIVCAPSRPIRLDTDTPAVIRSRPGGSAANTAAWLGSIGADVSFVGVVGTGDAERHAVSLPGVHVHLREHPDLSTGRVVIIIQGDRRDMLTDRGANAVLGPADVPDELLRRTRLLHMTGHVLLNRDGTAGVRTLIGRCRAAGILVSVSPGSVGFIADLGPGRVVDAFAGADIVFAGYDDGALLAGSNDPVEIVRALNARFDVAILTRGSAGVTAIESGEIVDLSIQPRPIVDPTGAGDAFSAGFLDSWLTTWDLSRAVAAGAEVAARSVGMMGGRPPTSAPREHRSSLRYHSG